jgi:hypothetical protein
VTRRNAVFAYDFRPRSHRWQVMAAVRPSELELMFAMTTVGGDFFRAYLNHDEAENW